jgi:hypothetical protein
MAKGLHYWVACCGGLIASASLAYQGNYYPQAGYGQYYPPSGYPATSSPMAPPARVGGMPNQPPPGYRQAYPSFQPGYGRQPGSPYPARQNPWQAGAGEPSGGYRYPGQGNPSPPAYYPQGQGMGRHGGYYPGPGYGQWPDPSQMNDWQASGY